MRIIHLVRMWPTNSDPQHGSFIKAHVQASKNLGNQIAVVYFGNKPIENQEIKTFHTQCRKGPLGWKVKLDYVIKAIKYLGGCELLHIHGGSADTAYMIIRLKSIYGKTLRFAVTEHQSHWFHKTPLGAKITARISDMRSAVSPALKSKIENYGVTNYIPNILIQPDPNQVEVIRKKPKTEKHRKFLFVGDIVDATKGISGILKAWGSHSQLFQEDILNIIGNGHDKQRLEAEFDYLENINWLGGKEPYQVHEEMILNDVLIVNSRVETFSMVIGEALERGLKVISTPCIGPQTVYPDVESLIFRKTFSTDELIRLMQEIKAVYSPIELDQFHEKKVSEKLMQWYLST